MLNHCTMLYCCSPGHLEGWGYLFVKIINQQVKDRNVSFYHTQFIPFTSIKMDHSIAKFINMVCMPLSILMIVTYF